MLKVVYIIATIVLMVAVVAGAYYLVLTSTPPIKEVKEWAITMEIEYMMGGTSKELQIFGNGTVKYVLVKGLSPPPPRPVTSTWVDKIPDSEIGALIELFKKNRFEELREEYTVDNRYTALDLPSDLGLMIIWIKHEDTIKEVRVYKYMNYKNVSEPPDAFNEIAKRLMDIISRIEASTPTLTSTSTPTPTSYPTYTPEQMQEAVEIAPRDPRVPSLGCPMVST